MLFTACLSILSWSDYRIDSPALGVLSDRQILAMAVGGEMPQDLAEELANAHAGPAITSEDLASRRDDARKEPVQLAMASFLGPPEPMFIERLRSRRTAPSSEFSMRIEAEHFVGPLLPASRAKTSPAVANDGDVAVVATAERGAVETPPADASATFEKDSEAVVAWDHERHGLPFDPLAVGPFLPASAPKRPQRRENPFQSFLTEQEELGGIETAAYTQELKHKIRQGETMTEVLANLGLEKEEIEEWIGAASREHNLNRIYTGQAVRLAMRMPAKKLASLKLELAGEEVLVAERDREGHVTARLEEIVYDRTLRVVGAEIEHSLYVSAQAEGMPDKIVSNIAEILGWDVNFSNVHRGATFRVVYEELTRPDTSQTVAGRVLAVELTNRGKRHEGFYFKMPDGSHAGYYNRAGAGLGRAFLRYPVEYSRISSHFTTKRFHPVLKRNVPHYGVDFAAPAGTPVRAVADGKVLKAGWYGGNGRFVKIQHDDVYDTGYAHLSGIEPAVKAGASVSKGQVIGYVGATGLATGPHLHFAMYQEQKYVDPLKAELPRPRALDGSTLAAFRMTVDMMDRAYAKSGEEDPEMTRIATASVDGVGLD